MRAGAADPWVAAPIDVLTGALAELGWQPRPPWCEEATAGCGPREPGPHGAEQLAFRRPGAVAGCFDGLAISRRREVLHGLPIWQLTLDAADAEAADARRRLIEGLLAGIAVMRPAKSPLPAVLELRHSASEIEARLAPAGAPPPACSKPPSSCWGRPLPVAPALPERLGDGVLWRVDGAQRCVALTFDACSTMDWGPLNAQVIEVLRREQMEATLFIGGHWAELHTEQLAALAAEPLFELGNHTYSHPHLTALAPQVVRQQVLWAQWAIFSRTGVVPTLLRPPYGEVDAAVARQVADLGLRTVQFDLPAGDADLHVSAERLTEWVAGRSRPGSIVVMHMNRPGNQTAAALPAIAKRLAARGLRPCRVSDMLASGGS